MLSGETGRDRDFNQIKFPMDMFMKVLKSLFFPGLLVLSIGVLGAFIFYEPFELYVVLLLDSSEKMEISTRLGVVVAGVILIWQVVISNKRAEAMYETAKAQVKTSEAQVRASEAQAKASEAQVEANKSTEKELRQDRFKNAIEHLGNDSESVRMGGAYELFHLAQDNVELRQDVLNILCAHVRSMTSRNEYREDHKTTPSEEIQSLMTLISVRDHGIFEDGRIDLRNSFLNGINLESARLRGANLFFADLNGAILSTANLQRADLGFAKLKGAWMINTNLEDANLHNANLRCGRIEHSQLRGASLEGAQLQNAILRHADLRGANLRYACLSGSNLTNADLQGAKLRNSILLGVHLFDANLRVSDLHGAILIRGEPDRSVHARSQIQECIYTGCGF